LHDRIISLRVEAWVQITSLFPPRIIEVPVPSQGSKLSCIFVLRVSVVFFSMIFLLDVRLITGYEDPGGSMS